MRRLLIVLATLALSACASVHRLDAANDVHALLLAIRDNDRAAFDAHVDRPALQQVIQAKIDERVGKDEKLKAIASLLGPSLTKFAGDTLLQPGTFKLVAQHYGYTDQTKIPGPVAIAGALKEMPDGRVCATRKKDGPCMLIFTKEQGVWKLSGFEGDTSLLRLKL